MRIPVLFALAALTACSAGQTSSGGVDIDPVTDYIGDWSAALQSVNNSGVVANATARSIVGAAGASIAIGGATSGAVHPWHIHRGTCASGGGIVGGADSYPPLRVGANGRADARASLYVGLSEDQQYHVNVHRSPTDLGTIVACGELRH